MRVAIQGCCHGELDTVYDVLKLAEEKSGNKIDLLICCGDFQAVRNCGDLNCMAAPVKYRHMQTFYKYYNGTKKAPMLTIFIGGNHEASNHLWELGFGGWVAPNIYYLGNAGVVRYGGLRIAGISGIYNENHYRKNRFEMPPYNPGTLRSTYHVRSCDVFRLKQLTGHIDIMLSHDWPRGIYNYGDKDLLLRLKSFFTTEVNSNTLGSPAAMELLTHSKPLFWFSGHLHVKFAALYNHTATKDHTPPATQGHTPHATQGHAPPATQGHTPPATQGHSPPATQGQLASPTQAGVESESADDSKMSLGEEDSADVSKTLSEPEGDKESADVDQTCPDGDNESADVSKKAKPVLVVDDGESATASGGDAVVPQGDASADDSNAGGGVSEGATDGKGRSEEEDQVVPVYTKFLALDKPLPKKRFLQILDISPSSAVETPYQLEYDREWLAILKSTECLMKYTNTPWLPPHQMTDQRLDYTPTDEELQEVEKVFAVEENGRRLAVPENFTQTVTPYADGERTDYRAVAVVQENPQTTVFCEKLGITNPFKPREIPVDHTPTDHTSTAAAAAANPDEIDLNDDVDDTTTHQSPAEPDGYKGSLGEGLLEWQVDTKPAHNRPPLNLPPPTTSPSDSNVKPHPMEQSHNTEEAESKAGVKPHPMEQSHDTEEAESKAGVKPHPMEQSHDTEEAESKAGVKRALSLSPHAVSAEESGVKGRGKEEEGDESGAANGDGPVIKRRNLDLYSGETDEEKGEGQKA